MIIKQVQSGRSMVEIMGYMVVAMFLMAGVAKVVTSAYGEYKLSQASMQISDFAGTIVKASAADVNYVEIVNIINGKSASGGSQQSPLEEKERKRLIPKSFRVIDEGTITKIYNVFGGEVKISVPSNDFASDYPGDQFAIQFLGLDRDQCISLMSKEWYNNRVVDLYAIVLTKVGNDPYYWFWPAYHPASKLNEYPLPVKIAEIAGSGETEGLCGADNNIMWVFN